MYHLEGYEWAIWGLSLVSATVFGAFAARNTKSRLTQKKFLMIKKVCLGVFILTSMYWIITFPFAGSYSDDSDKSDYPANINAEEQSDYINKNHREIEILKRRLERTTNKLESVSERMRLMLQVLMYGLISFGFNRIFTSNETGEEKSYDITNLKL